MKRITNNFLICRVCFLAFFSIFGNQFVEKTNTFNFPDNSLIVSRITRIPGYFPDMFQVERISLIFNPYPLITLFVRQPEFFRKNLCH